MGDKHPLKWLTDLASLGPEQLAEQMAFGSLGINPRRVDLRRTLQPKGYQKVRRRVRRQLEDRLGEKISKDQLEEALGNVSLADLSELGVGKGAFRREVRRRGEQAGLFIGRQMKDPTILRESYGLPAAGEGIQDFERTFSGAPTLEEEIGQSGGDLQQILEGPSRDLIDRGLALLSGDTSSPLAKDLLLSYNERFTQPLTTRGLARSGQADFARSIGAQEYLRQTGLQDVQSGLGLLQAGNPLAFPQTEIGLLQQARQQNLFNALYTISYRQAQEAASMLNQRPNPLPQVIGEGIQVGGDLLGYGLGVPGLGAAGKQVYDRFVMPFLS